MALRRLKKGKAAWCEIGAPVDGSLKLKPMTYVEHAEWQQRRAPEAGMRRTDEGEFRISLRPLDVLNANKWLLKRNIEATRGVEVEVEGDGGEVTTITAELDDDLIEVLAADNDATAQIARAMWDLAGIRPPSEDDEADEGNSES